MKLETVTIVVPGHPDGRVDINASDYKPGEHTLWSPPEVEPAPEAAPEPDARPKGKRAAH